MTYLGFDVPSALDGERVDRVLSLLSGAPRSVVARAIGRGMVRVDGDVVQTRSGRVAEGQRLEADLDEEEPEDEAPGAVPFEVVYADAAILVVDKPSGVVVHPGAGRRSGTLSQALASRFPEIATVGERGRPGIVHRLDAGTSGLLVVARTERAYASLVAQIAAREVERRYLCLVRGSVDSERGTVDAPVGRSRSDPTRMTVSAGGRPARTRYEVVERLHRPSETTLLRCWLETGRTHQIRVHLAAIGHPLVGDERYGAEASKSLGRPFLHAERLVLRHPASAETMAWDSPLPAELERELASCRGPGSARGCGEGSSSGGDVNAAQATSGRERL